MGKSIFREKSIEKISSPDEIDDYIKIITPKIWIILVVTIMIILGGIFWSSTRTIELNIVENGKIVTKEVPPISLLIQ